MSKRLITQSLNRKGFTLIELLVVVAIISILMAVLLPALGRARKAAKDTRCMANLRSIGQAIKMYMEENHSFYPPMAFLPTQEANNHPTNARQPMTELLAPYLGMKKEIFRCPTDRLINPAKLDHPGEVLAEVGSPGNHQTWCDWQGSSYSPLFSLSTNLLNVSQDLRITPQLSQFVTSAGQDPYDIAGYLGELPIVFDYEKFHSLQDEWFLSGRMVLYADFHVQRGTKVRSEEKIREYLAGLGF